jgi:hypothetical protein
MRHLLIKFPAMLTNVCHLTVLHGRRERLCDLNIAEWVGLLRMFPAVETLHVCGQLAKIIDPVFDRLIGETVAEVLPVLRFLHIESPVDKICSAVPRHTEPPWIPCDDRQNTGAVQNVRGCP